MFIFFLTLSPQDFLVRDVLDKLADVGFSAANWRELGERLIPKADFPSIEEDHQTCDKRLRAVIDEWQRKGSNPCWETLATAVAECKKYGGQNVAQKLLKSVGIGGYSIVSVSIITNCQSKIM